MSVLAFPWLRCNVCGTPYVPDIRIYHRVIVGSLLDPLCVKCWTWATGELAKALEEKCEN